MNYTIYSIGDTEFLFSVLNGIVRIFDTSVSGFASYVAIASFLVLLGGLMGRVFNDKATPLKDWIFGLIFFFILAGPYSKADVQIESVRTGQVWVVDDVPLFAALGGYLTTSLSHLIAQDFQQSFQSVNGAVFTSDPLRALQQAHNLGLSQNKIAGVSEDYDPIGSIQNYIKSCYVAQMLIDDSLISKESELKNTSLAEGWDAIKVTTNTLRTTVFLGNGKERMSCGTAHASIKVLFFDDGAKFRAMVDRYFIQNNIDKNTFLDSFNHVLVSNSSGETAATAYNAAAGIFLNNQLLIASSNGNGTAGFYDSVDRERFTARHNRLYTMASERGMWMEMSVGMVTILEAFVFFITPIMAIMLVMGGMGLKAVVTYFGLCLWVNFWPITMNFVNLYTEMAVAGKFDGLGGAAATFGMFDESMTTIESSIAFASQLTAMVPMLTLFILYRGVHTMMGVASQTAPNTFSGQSAGQGSLVKGEAGSYVAGNTKMEMAGAGTRESQIINSTGLGNSTGLNQLASGFSGGSTSSGDVSNSNTNAAFKKSTLQHANNTLAKVAVTSGSGEVSAEQLASQSSKSIGIAAKVASTTTDVSGEQKQNIFKVLNGLSGEGSVGFDKIPGVKGKIASKMSVDELAAVIDTNTKGLADGKSKEIAESYMQTLQDSSTWTKSDATGKTTELSDAYATSKMRADEYAEAQQKQAKTTAAFTRATINSIGNELEQAANSSAMSQRYTQAQYVNGDTKNTHITGAVNGMGHEEVKSWAVALGMDPSSVKDMKSKDQKEAYAAYVDNHIQEKQDELFDSLAKDVNYRGRSDLDGVAAHQAILSTYREVSDDTTAVSSNDAGDIATARIKESSDELRGLGQIYKGLGENPALNSASLTSTGNGLIKNAGLASAAVDKENAIKVANETDMVPGTKGGVSLDDNRKGETITQEAEKLHSKSASRIESNKRDIPSVEGEVKKKVQQAEGTEQVVNDAIETRKTELIPKQEHLEDLTEKVDATRNVAGNMVGVTTAAFTTGVDALGSSAGPSEVLEREMQQSKEIFPERVSEGFTLLTNSNEKQIDNILKNGLDPKSKEYEKYRDDASNIMFAASNQGQALYQDTIRNLDDKNHSGSNRSQKEKENFGDGVEKNDWARLSTNMDYLNDKDTNGNGVISENERGAISRFVHNPATQDNAVNALAATNMISDRVVPQAINGTPYRVVEETTSRDNQRVEKNLINSFFSENINQVRSDYGLTPKAPIPNEQNEKDHLFNNPLGVFTGFNTPPAISGSTSKEQVSAGLYGIYNQDETGGYGSRFNSHLKLALDGKNAPAPSNMNGHFSPVSVSVAQDLKQTEGLLRESGHDYFADRVKEYNQDFMSSERITQKEVDGNRINKELIGVGPASVTSYKQEEK